MAHKKGLGSSRNGRDSNAKRLGVKVFAGQAVTGGEIIVRQRGTRFKPGVGVGIGKDDTIYAKAAGTVDFREGRRGRVISVVPEQLIERRGRALAVAHEREPARPVGRLDHGLGGHGAHARLGPAHDRADAEEVRLDCHAELAARRVSCDDRVGQSGEATRRARPR